MSYTKLVRMPIELRDRIDAEIERNGGSYKERGHISANALCVKAIEFFLDSLSIHMDNESEAEENNTIQNAA